MAKRARMWRRATRGVLALTVLAVGASAHPQPGAWTTATPAALAQELNCIDDKDHYDLPECVQEREAAQRAAEQAQRDREAAAEAEANEPPPPPPAPKDDPTVLVFKIGDAGKEATQYLSEDGTDKHGRWARTRFERDRGNSASTLGPNVIDTKVWVTKDAEAAKALFKEQAGIKNFPEKTEGVDGPNDKIGFPKPGDEFAVVSSYFQDEKVWHHYRVVIRRGNNVGVMYLFGREDFFLERKNNNRTWNGQGDWYVKEFGERI
jgi:hypothetical protein